MAYNGRILLDSISPAGHRLTTFEVTFPRIVLAEFNTHRMLSRNSASSRAIPVEKQIKRLNEDPFFPIYWGKNQKGMQANEELSGEQQERAVGFWSYARALAIYAATGLLELGVHKQITNRLLEPFMWHTVVVSSTEWDNAFALRRHKDAQPEIRKAFDLLWDLREASTPKYLDYGEWHLPLTPDVGELLASGLTSKDVQKVSIGRVARVSYLTHDGKRDPSADIGLYESLKNNGHMSPLEHVARPMTERERSYFCRATPIWNEAQQDWMFGPPTFFLGNFNGWVQHRKLIRHEDDFSKKEE